MKKILFVLTVGCGCLFAACGSDENEAHQTYFYPDRPGGLQLYADQTEDTLHIVSLDSWSVTPSADWLSVSPEAENIPSGYILDRRMDISATPNVTGKNRAAVLSVKAYEHTLSVPVSQASWLNVIHPQGEIDMTADFETRRPSFVMNLKPTTTDTTIVFKVYEDGATLQSADPWIVPEARLFEAGEHSVRLTVESNPAPQDRRTKLTLTSAGISTEIEMKQPPRQ